MIEIWPFPFLSYSSVAYLFASCMDMHVLSVAFFALYRKKYSLLKVSALSWQHDAACRVIARLKKERDEARALLAQAERQVPMAATTTAPNGAALSNGKRGP